MSILYANVCIMLPQGSVLNATVIVVLPYRSVLNATVIVVLPHGSVLNTTVIVVLPHGSVLNATVIVVLPHGSYIMSADLWCSFIANILSSMNEEERSLLEQSDLYGRTPFLKNANERQLNANVHNARLSQPIVMELNQIPEQQMSKLIFIVESFSHDENIREPRLCLKRLTILL